MSTRLESSSATMHQIFLASSPGRQPSQTHQAGYFLPWETRGKVSVGCGKAALY